MVIAYYVRSTMEFEKAHSSDDTPNILFNSPIPHYRFGLGTAAFVPSLVKFKVSDYELEQNFDVEMIFGQQCHDRNIQVVTPKRPNQFVVFIKSKGVVGIDKYALHMTGSAHRTNKTY